MLAGHDWNTVSVFLHVRVDPRDEQRWREQARAHGLSLSAWLSARLDEGTAVTASTSRGFARGALLVSVADDVDHVPVWVAHEEPADAPRFVGQRMNDLVAAALRFGVGLVDVVPDVH